MNTEAWTQLIRHKPALMQMVHRFQFRPATYMDQGYFRDWLPTESLPQLLASSRGEQRLSELIQQRFALAGDYADFAQPRLRLALLDAATWNRLLAVAAPTMVSPLVAREIRRDAVLSWKQALGDTGYLFAVKRASTLIPQQTLAEVLNEFDTTAAKSPDRLRWRPLELCFSGEPAALVNRIRIKFPREAELNFTRPVDASRKEAAWRILKKLLLSEVDASWTQWLE